METTNRDEETLKDSNLRVYQFRGWNIFELNKEHKRLYIGLNARECLPIKDDCRRMANFLLECEKFLNGEVEDIENVVVY